MAGGSSLWLLQKAIYKTLSNDPQLMSKLVGVYDFVPDNNTFPYVQIGEFTTNQFETMDRYGQEVMATIHVWCRRIGSKAYQGMKQCEDIMEDIQRLLARGYLNVEQWGNAGCWNEFSQTMLDSDGITRHGILRYRILLLQDFTLDL